MANYKKYTLGGIGMEKGLFMIRAISNMHVGSGASVGIVDNVVQRDPVDNLPIIHASSLKGALREYCESGPGKNVTGGADNFVEVVFGKELGKPEETVASAGKFRFLGARLISIPCRGEQRAYYNGVSSNLLKELLDFLTELDVAPKTREAVENLYSVECTGEEVKIEGIYTGKYIKEANDLIKNLFGEHIVILPDDDFRTIATELPVIARNHLENGTSKNLWYEEVIPRESRLAFVVMGHEEIYFNDFTKRVTNGILQIGANASIGYGFSRLALVE